jgi:hypothetical protein
MKRLVTLATLVLFATGCMTMRGMQEVALGQAMNTTPPSGKAAIVFLRPSLHGYTASVFELKPDANVFAGHVLPYKKLLYLTDPGPTRFMVSGQGADLMGAELEAGKTYYVIVAPGSGTGFSLRPVTRSDDADLPRWLQDCAWIETGPGAQQWARQHAAAIQKRREQLLPRWEARPDKPMLRARDSR